ncbi:MAG: DegT/DnrJ/EryC1/StrS family aminotransferase [Candidatus Saccharicenans sp.]
MQKIHMSQPDLRDDDIKAVLETLQSTWLALGPKAVEFEKMISKYIGANHAIAVSSGTAALHILVRALDIKPGDEVLVPSFTFASSVNAILYERAIPVFVDVESDTFNVDTEDLEKKITPKTKAIMAVDVFGHPAEWDEILRIADKYNLRIIDDSCEALGAVYKGKKIGQFGDAAAFAFYPNKQMTTGEGGIIVTNNEKIARIARSLRNQGRGEMGAWLEHETLGYNYRMDEMSAALGVSQLKKLDYFLEKREKVSKLYTEKLKNLPGVRPPIVKPYVKMSWFVYVVLLEKGIDRNFVIKELEKMGIPSRGYFLPIHLQAYIKNYIYCEVPRLPVTEDIGQRTLALPFHNNLTEEEIDIVVEALKEVIRKS